MRRAALILTVTAAAMLWASTALAQTAPEGNLPTGTGVARDINLNAIFSEEMNQSTLTESTFKLYKVIRNSGGSTTLQQITDVGMTPSGDGFSVKLDPYPLEPSKLLAANTRYKVVITTGAKDVAGKRLDQQPAVSGSRPKSWTFTTSGRLLRA